ncbi:MAG: carboxypeptidase M32 [Trueperaceae bacterium]
MPYPSKVAEDLAALRRRFALLDDLSQIGGLLSWDQHTYMPSGAAESRGRHSAALESVLHEKLSDPAVGKWLSHLEDAELEGDDAAMVRLCRRRFKRAVCLPAELVEALATGRSRAQEAWLGARRDNDFASFAPHLQWMFELSREQAELIGYVDHPYDALHEEYEPGSSSKRVRELFAQLRPALVDLVKRAAGEEQQDAVLYGEFDVAKQEEFLREAVARFGFDFRRGRLDPTVHPFAEGVDRTDVRITTRYSREYLARSLFATFHEAGHGLYEQGLPSELSHGPVGESVSLGVHESQSRMWENLVGRSLPFWRGEYPRLQKYFPALDGIDLEKFHRAVNCVKPSFIRVEADEVTYNLHVIARFELEVAMLDGSLVAADLPEAWNSSYRDLLDIEPPDYLLGCLQDVHWSVGLIGYFPTYTLGNLMSVQLFDAARGAMPDLDLRIEAGDHGALLDWLRRNIHRQGSRFGPDELLERVTGSPLDAAPYLRYLTNKFEGLRQPAGSS